MRLCVVPLRIEAGSPGGERRNRTERKRLCLDTTESFAVQVVVKEPPTLDLAARHQGAVAVEGDRDRRVTEVGAQGLGVQVRRDGDAGVGVATLVETERLQARLLPARVDAAAQYAGVGWPLGVVGARKEQAVGRVASTRRGG